MDSTARIYLAIDLQSSTDERGATEHREDTAFAARLILSDSLRDLLAKLSSFRIIARESVGQASNELLVHDEASDLVSTHTALAQTATVTGDRATLRLVQETLTPPAI